MGKTWEWETHLQERRTKYPRDMKFKNVCEFVCDPEILPEKIRALFCDVFKGEPFQGYLYNTIIWNMKDTKYETVVETAAELYHFQRQLNKKIGRTCYDKIVKDDTLMKHIYNEIIFRFKETESYEYNEDFEKEVMKLYLRDYAKSAKEAKTPAEVLSACKGYAVSHPAATVDDMLRFMNSITPEAEEDLKEVKYMDYLKECLKRNKPENNPKNSCIWNAHQYTTLLDMHSGSWSENKLPKEKDELYIICIGLALTNSDFQNLRAALAREYRDSARFADNTYSYRDEKIQSVLRDIGAWYEKVHEKNLNLPIEFLPQKVLQEVDCMLKENGYDLLYEPKRIKKQKR